MNSKSQDQSVADIVMCAGIKCKCSVTNAIAKENAFCSSVCKNSIVDQTIDQVNDHCDCAHKVCDSQKQTKAFNALNSTENLKS